MQTAFEWPHETAAREKAACVDPRDFRVSDELVERTAALMGMEPDLAGVALVLSVAFVDGLEGAEGFLTYGNPTDRQWKAVRQYVGALNRLQAETVRRAA